MPFVTCPVCGKQVSDQAPPACFLPFDVRSVTTEWRDFIPARKKTTTKRRETHR